MTPVVANRDERLVRTRSAPSTASVRGRLVGERRASQRSLPGTYSAVAAGDRLLLGHGDGIQLVNATTFAVERTFDPALLLRGTVGGDLLAVGPGDSPATAAVRSTPDARGCVELKRSPNPATPATAWGSFL